MELIIKLDGNNIGLAIKHGRKTVAQSFWAGEHSLSEKLLPEIDALLKKNKISKNKIGKVSTKISRTSGVTSARIVQTVAKAWKTGQKR
jgi:hypothetical protein